MRKVFKVMKSSFFLWLLLIVTCNLSGCSDNGGSDNSNQLPTQESGTEETQPITYTSTKLISDFMNLKHAPVIEDYTPSLRYPSGNEVRALMDLTRSSIKAFLDESENYVKTTAAIYATNSSDIETVITTHNNLDVTTINNYYSNLGKNLGISLTTPTNTLITDVNSSYQEMRLNLMAIAILEP